MAKTPVIEQPAQSAKYSLNKQDGKKILKGLGIAVGGAALTYLLDLVPNVDFGQYSLMIVPIASTLINAALKYIQGKEQ